MAVKRPFSVVEGREDLNERESTKCHKNNLMYSISSSRNKRVVLILFVNLCKVIYLTHS